MQRRASATHLTRESLRLTLPTACLEDSSVAMKKSFLICAITSAAIYCALSVSPLRTSAQPPPRPAPPQNNASARVTIQVTGGEKDAPIENASVYLKFVEEHKLGKDKQHELNVKTNREGVAHVPDAPIGRVLIQIVAEGWKTYGRWFDITDSKEPIKIHLDRPPKWY
jgi:hypothetical protein